MADDAHEETAMRLCMICGEPYLSEGGITHGVCTDCYRLNFAGVMQPQAPRREHGEDMLTARQREALRYRLALRQWANPPRPEQARSDSV